MKRKDKKRKRVQDAVKFCDKLLGQMERLTRRVAEAADAYDRAHDKVTLMIEQFQDEQAYLASLEDIPAGEASVEQATKAKGKKNKKGNSAKPKTPSKKQLKKFAKMNASLKRPAR